MARALREAPRALPEYRLHPDDYDALRRQVPLAAGDPGLTGLRIVLDETAERLPRLGPIRKWVAA